jgi:hypothetical protein
MLLYEAYTVVFRLSLHKEHINIDDNTKKEIRQTSLVGELQFLFRLQGFLHELTITTPANIAAATAYV